MVHMARKLDKHMSTLNQTASRPRISLETISTMAMVPTTVSGSMPRPQMTRAVHKARQRGREALHELADDPHERV